MHVGIYPVWWWIRSTIYDDHSAACTASYTVQVVVQRNSMLDAVGAFAMLNGTWSTSIYYHDVHTNTHSLLMYNHTCVQKQLESLLTKSSIAFASLPNPCKANKLCVCDGPSSTLTLSSSSLSSSSSSSSSSSLSSAST